MTVFGLPLPLQGAGAGAVESGPAPSAARLALVNAACAGCVAVTTLVVARSDVLANPGVNAGFRAAAIASWVWVGAWTWRLRPASRLGPLLVATGFAFAATTAMAFADPGVFTLGRLAWAAFAAIVSYTLLAFPHGRIPSRRAVVLFRAWLAVVAVAWSALLLGARELPLGGVLTRCDGACPENPYRVVDAGGALAATLGDAATLATSAMLLAVAVLMLQQLRAAGGRDRATLEIPLAVVVAFVTTVAVSNALRATDGASDAALALGWLGAAAGVAAPWALLAGQTRGRLFDSALLMSRNAALEAELRATAQELHASRARIFSAGAAERRRIERDLHDSGQNRLVALRIKLELAAEEAEEEGASELLHARLVALGDEAQEALDAVRAVAHGIHPPLLESGGLLAALEVELQGAARPVAVQSRGAVPRSTPEAEEAVYYCCLEAVQNACKHAGPAAQVTIRLRCDGASLDFAVSDDGPGFGDTVVAESTGLTHMRDRILAVGGSVEFTTCAGAVVHGHAPWPRRPPLQEGAP